MNDVSHEDQVELLAAENASLRGRLAARGPAPLATNGEVVAPELDRYTTMREAFWAACAELNWRPRG